MKRHNSLKFSGIFFVFEKKRGRFPNSINSIENKPFSFIKDSKKKGLTLYYYSKYELDSYRRSNQDTPLSHRPFIEEGDWVQKGDLLADASSSQFGELALGHNIWIGYMPFNGYNFEDAISISQRLVLEDLYTSIHIENYETEIHETPYGMEEINRQIPNVSPKELAELNSEGIVRLGTVVKEGAILVGKRAPIPKKENTSYQNLLYTILEKNSIPFRDQSLRVPKGLIAKVIGIEIQRVTPSKVQPSKIVKVTVSLAEKRRIGVGDKMAGRHGNKGIISQILPRYDMPYLPDGTPLDLILNPLGVPSRMNVGQIYECLLGLAGKFLGEGFRICPFDEIYGAEASRSLVYSKLYEARCQTISPWLFNPNYPGKTFVWDGQTGEPYHNPITVGIAYILKLVHLVSDKIHAHSTGPYSLVTQQPLRGRSKHGGQRLGEMEVWALEGYGAAFVLLEMLTIKSDDLIGRTTLWSNLILNKPIHIGTPESFKVLVCELQALCLDLGIFRSNSKGLPIQIDHIRQLA
jgi:DNA-directed RNA polymerase subunit beta